MNINYEIKKDINKNYYIEIPFLYDGSDIEIRIYKDKVIAKGIDEQILFYNYIFNIVQPDTQISDIIVKTYKNQVDLFIQQNTTDLLNINIKQVKNRLFFKLYKNDILVKRAFCYINKENKYIYENSSYTLLKHLLNHTQIEKYNVVKISDKEIYIESPKSNETFLISVFDNDIIKIKYSIDGNIMDIYSFTKESLYHINNLDLFAFLLGTKDTPKEEINKIKLSRKMNEF